MWMLIFHCRVWLWSLVHYLHILILHILPFFLQANFISELRCSSTQKKQLKQVFVMQPGLKMAPLRQTRRRPQILAALLFVWAESPPNKLRNIKKHVNSTSSLKSCEFRNGDKQTVK